MRRAPAARLPKRGGLSQLLAAAASVLASAIRQAMDRLESGERRCAYRHGLGSPSMNPEQPDARRALRFGIIPAQVAAGLLWATLAPRRLKLATALSNHRRRLRDRRWIKLIEKDHSAPHGGSQSCPSRTRGMNGCARSPHATRWSRFAPHHTIV
jgi:hypothetical protein